MIGTSINLDFFVLRYALLLMPSSIQSSRINLAYLFTHGAVDHQMSWLFYCCHSHSKYHEIHSRAFVMNIKNEILICINEFSDLITDSPNGHTGTNNPMSN